MVFNATFNNISVIMKTTEFSACTRVADRREALSMED
jgi:hypothetical protein